MDLLHISLLKSNIEFNKYLCACSFDRNVNHKTCPICRETLQSTDDTWVLSEVPEAQEISDEIRSSLFKLVEDQGSPSKMV